MRRVRGAFGKGAPPAAKRGGRLEFTFLSRRIACLDIAQRLGTSVS